VDAEAQAVENQLRDGQTGSQDFALQGGDVLCIDQFVIHCGNRVLPDESLRRHLGAEITRAWPMSRCVSLNHARANASAN